MSRLIVGRMPGVLGTRSAPGVLSAIRSADGHRVWQVRLRELPAAR